MPLTIEATNLRREIDFFWLLRHSQRPGFSLFESLIQGGEDAKILKSFETSPIDVRSSTHNRIIISFTHINTAMTVYQIA
jgi:hypothetical protein